MRCRGGLCFGGRREHSVQRRSGARQRRIPRAFALNTRLTSRSSGYSGKTTRSKSFSIPVRTRSRSGVSARSPPRAGTPDAGRTCKGKTLLQPRKHTLTECCNCTCCAGGGQCGLARRSPLRRHLHDQRDPTARKPSASRPHRRRHYHEVHRRKILQGINFLPVIDSQHSSADEKQR